MGEYTTTLATWAQTLRAGLVDRVAQFALAGRATELGKLDFAFSLLVSA
jgi:hypothetical protein